MHLTDKTKVILTGDFNLPNVDWASGKVGKTEVASSELLLDIS